MEVLEETVPCRVSGIYGTDEKGKNSRVNSPSQMQRDQCNRGTLMVPQSVTAISEFKLTALNQVRAV